MATPVITAEMQRANMELVYNPRKRGLDPGERWTASLRKEAERQIKATGADRPVTLLNLNPFSLKINGGALFPEEIEAKPIDKPYTVHVFRETRWQGRDKGCDMSNMMQIEPVPYIPMRLAAEYMREYVQNQGGFGGVICYMGDHAPETIKKGDTVLVPEMAYDENGELFMNEVKKDFHQLLHMVRIRRNTAILNRIQDANAWYENDSQRMNVNDQHRDMARLAKEEGLIETLPRWVLVGAESMQAQPDPCPICRVTPKAGALMCVNCNYVIDVVETFRHRPSECVYGCAEMDRLTAEQWKVVDAIHAERTKLRDARKAKV